MSDTKKIEVALYHNEWGDWNVWPPSDYWDDPGNGYVRVSEATEVEFTLLPPKQVLDQKVGAIDKKIEDERARHGLAMSRLDDDKQKLMAIAYEPEQT